MPRITPEQFQQYQQQRNQAVEDGDVEGQRQKTNAAYWLAYCYYCGQGGVEEDDEQVVQILEQTIQDQDHMDDDSIHDNTGKHRFLLARLIEDNQQRANRLFQQAAPRLEAEVQEGGHDENFQQAALDLGLCLFLGKGADRDPSRGIHLLKNASELGHKGAQVSIERCCSRYPQYVAEVFDWWLEMAGAEHGHAWAQMALGECFRYGRGVEKDLIKAVEWYNKAIAQGNHDAAFRMQRLLNELNPEERRKTFGCVTRNQKIDKVEHLIEQPEPDSVPLGLWAHVIATLQHQEYPPWEAPSPIFLALSGGITPHLDQSSDRKRTLPSED